MRHLTKRTVGGLALGCLMAYSAPPTNGLALPLQKITPVPTRPAVETGAPNRPNRNPTLARNTAAKPEAAAPATTSPKATTAASKNTISRCWKRLMNMVREANHAHKNK